MSFADGIVKRHIVKPLAHLICVYIKPIPSIDLGEMIDGGWSLVESIKLRPKEELLKNVEDALQMDPLLYSFYRSYKSKAHHVEESKSEGFNIAGGIDVERLIAHIRTELPEHSAVLERHIDWVNIEISRVQDLLV